MPRLFIILSVFVLLSCIPEKKAETAVLKERNPAADGFNAEASDSIAVALADQVMKAMGGRMAWDNARFFTWKFFVARRLIWDKLTGKVRIESLKGDLKIIVNTKTMEGIVQKEGKEITHQDSLAHYLRRGKSIWINDSYWLVMPFKLKDSGVTIKYMREDTTKSGELSDVLRLTFENVGDTPDNAYEVWVSKENKLIKQWAFYRTREQIEPNFYTPWQDYQRFGKILLSGNRGKGSLTEIQVIEKVPENTFKNFDPIEF